MISYQRLEDDVKRICQKLNTIRVYHPNPQATPEQAWKDIPEKIKKYLLISAIEVIIHPMPDLLCNGMHIQGV